MEKKNKTLKEIFAGAFENYKKGDLKIAENFCYKILSIDSNHFDSILLLASIFAKNNNFNKAKQFLHKAIEIQPKNVSAFNNLATAYKALGNLKEAINYYNKVIEIDSNHVKAHYNLGTTFYQLKELKKAKSSFQKAVEINNNFALAFFGLANVHVDLKEFENAVSCYQKAITINPEFHGAHNNLGLTFRELNDLKNAISCYEKVIGMKPDHVGAHHNLALAYKEMGEFKKAIKSHQTAIKYEPENSLHYFYLSELKKDLLDSQTKNKIEKIIKNDESTKNNIAYANYLLSRYEKKLKSYEQELNYLKKGHQYFFDSRKEKFKLAVKYCFDDILQISKDAHTSKLNNNNDYNVKPIFIIGVPRSGSTLVEKIIASGKKLIPVGEETAVLENFFNNKILEKQSLDLGDVKSIRNELYDLYKQKGLISKKYDYIFTDKSLNNFFYLGLIKEIYPSAKVINCRRDILSSIMSIFQNNLTELAWTHDLENVFKYFNNYFKITKNFDEVSPNFMYELQFEKLVNNPEEESKKLMKFCELPWDKKCLEFYKRKDLISKTTSNVQIRQAIYKHSLDKYLPYKKFLEKYGNKYSWFN